VQLGQSCKGNEQIGGIENMSNQEVSNQTTNQTTNQPTNQPTNARWLSLEQKVDSARDFVGVVRADGLQKQLGNLTAEDWQILSQKLYPKKESDPDGFYIVDANDKDITVHNDLRTANRVLNQSFWEGAKDDFKRSGSDTTLVGMEMIAPGAFTGAMAWTIGADIATHLALPEAVIFSGMAISAGIGAVALTGLAVGGLTYLGVSNAKRLAKDDLATSQFVATTLQAGDLQNSVGTTASTR
jgi:hypothetical protein